MKGILIKDPHLNIGFENRIRKNYNHDVNMKHDFVSDYCLRNDIKHVIFSGDLLNEQKHESRWSFRQYRKNKEFLREKYVSKGIQLHSIAGNHDFLAGNKKLEDSVFNDLVDEKVINYITMNPVILGNWAIYGVDYNNDISIVTEKIRAINEIASQITQSVMVVIHQNVLPESNIMADYTYDFLLDAYSDIDAFFCGHYHVGFPTYEKKGRYIFNPWNMFRVARDYSVKMDEFKVEMIEVDFGQLNKIDYKHIEIPHAKFKDAFVSEYLEFLNVSKKEQFDFFKNVDFDELVKDSDDDKKIIEKLAADHGFSSEIIKKAMEYLNG